ncbi:MAG: hypothetical protein HQL38_18110 [Alphaproteobacteria bacterium]|nr:hypothetical protein [Alphaproteobacteria bacterium]
MDGTKTQLLFADEVRAAREAVANNHDLEIEEQPSIHPVADGVWIGISMFVPYQGGVAS